MSCINKMIGFEITSHIYISNNNSRLIDEINSHVVGWGDLVVYWHDLYNYN